MPGDELWTNPKQAQRIRAHKEAKEKLKLGSYTCIFCSKNDKEGNYAVQCKDRRIKGKQRKIRK